MSLLERVNERERERERKSMRAERMRMLERKNDEYIRGIIIIVVRISSRDLCDDGNDVEHDTMTTMFFPPPCPPGRLSSWVRQDAINRRGF